MIDLNLLRLMRLRKNYKRLVAFIPKAALNTQTRLLLLAYGKYFKRYQETEIDFQKFKTEFYLSHPNLSTESIEYYDKVFERVVELPDSDVEEVLKELHEIRLATEIFKACSEWSEGTLLKPFSQVVAENYLVYTENVKVSQTAIVMDSIEDILSEDTDKGGIKFRLGVLKRHLRGMLAGDSIIIAARPDKGKTSFLASEATYWATQIDDDEVIVWFNNEGPGRRIIPRLYQAALDKNINQISEMNKGGTLRDAYAAAIGNADKIKVIDIHGMHYTQIEAIIEQYRPRIIIYDMMDNVKGFENTGRTDEKLEHLYQWAREAAVRHNAICILTSQISESGAGMQYPDDWMLKDSRTGKQGACEAIIMIGHNPAEGYERIRYISTPKNKLAVPGKAVNPHAEVRFNPENGRYEDL